MEVILRLDVSACFHLLWGQSDASFPYKLNHMNGCHILLRWPPNPSTFTLRRWSVVDDSWIVLLMLIWYYIFQCYEPGTPDVARSSTFWRAHHAHGTPHLLTAESQNHNQMWDLECHISICGSDRQDINATCGGEDIRQAVQQCRVAFISLHVCPPSPFRSRCYSSCCCERLIFLTWIDDVGCGACFLANQCKGSKQCLFVLTFFPH